MISKLFQVGILFSLFLFTACQEFVHDSFDTFSGRVVSESGQPISGVELVFTQDLDFTDFQNTVSNSAIYTMRTDVSGRFKFVVPTRNFDNVYYLQIKPPYRFVIDFGGEKEFRNYILESNSDRDAFGVVSLGDLIVVEK
jgi:hypothetical protein